MGERVAYRVRYGDKTSFMLRKQWYFGSSHKELTALVGGVAETLMADRFKIGKPNTIGGGMVALRSDLDMSRLVGALMSVVYSPPFDEIVEPDNLNCDINDHGIYEIELVKWNKWNLNQYDVDWEKDKGSSLGKKTHLATINFEDKKPFPEGMTFDWHVPSDWEYPDETSSNSNS